MSTKQLKEEIASKLEQTENAGILHEVYNILHSQVEKEPSFEFADDAWVEVMEAVKEDEAGQTYSDAEVMAHAWQLIADFEKIQSSE